LPKRLRVRIAFIFHADAQHAAGAQSAARLSILQHVLDEAMDWPSIRPYLGAGWFLPTWIQLRSAIADELLKNTSFGDLNPRHFLNRLLSLSMTNAISCSVMEAKLRFCEKYWRTSPFMFSFVARSQDE